MRESGAVGQSSIGFGCLIRRKRVDSARPGSQSSQQLAKRLSVFDLIAIGVGATIGAGVYILVGSVARKHTGPAITFSFLIAGLAAGLSALCYAELACRCPSAGSAYHYCYLCVGEGLMNLKTITSLPTAIFSLDLIYLLCMTLCIIIALSVAWLIGWSLILEYTLGGAAAARGMSPNMALLFGGADNLPAFFACRTILGVVVDPCAAILVFLETGLLCTGIKESSLAQAVVTTINIFALIFIITAGSYLGFKNGWVGYELPSGPFPFGLSGILSGSARVFFSYVGFDALTSTAEEVQNPQRDLPLGIGISLSMCCILYMLVSAVILGLVPYYALDPFTPISSAFSNYGMDWAEYVVTTGTVTSLCAALMGSILPQPRVLMAMARDGLLPSFFGDINKHSQVPVKSTIMTGIFIASLAFLMDVSQLADMVSVGTLLAFTTVAVSVLVLRYVPPQDVPLPSSEHSCMSPCRNNIQDIDDDDAKGFIRYPLIQKSLVERQEHKRRKIASWNITIVCLGIVILASAASAKDLPRDAYANFLDIPRLLFCGLGGALLLCGLIVLTCLDQDDARHSFGHSGGFLCPFVPFLPAACIFLNTYLLINLGVGTWICVSIWLVIGGLIYLFYGRKHSSLSNAVYVPAAHEIYCSSPDGSVEGMHHAH